MTEQPPAPAKRLPFNEHLVKHAQGFAQVMLNDIPELESIAIVFGYAVPNKDLPYAVVLGQSGALKSPTEIVHMSQQLWQTLNFQLQSGYRCIQALDGHMKDKADELKALQGQIDAAKQTLANLPSGGDATSSQ